METVFIQIRAPRRQDFGRVLEGHYNVVDDTVVLVDRAGKPLKADDKNYSRKLAAGDNAKQVAGQLLRSHYNATRGGSPQFGSSLLYPKLRY
jgi:hypothetical protein